MGQCNLQHYLRNASTIKLCSLFIIMAEFSAQHFGEQTEELIDRMDRMQWHLEKIKIIKPAEIACLKAFYYEIWSKVNLAMNTLNEKEIAYKSHLSNGL